MKITMQAGDSITAVCNKSEKAFTIICREDQCGIFFGVREFHNSAKKSK